MTKMQPFGEIELAIDGAEQKWKAEIEAQGTDHLRVRLAANSHDQNRFTIGSKVTCTIEESEERFSAEARVLSQNGPTLWLNVEPQWRKGGRRSHARVDGGFGVTYTVGEETGIGLCLNVSSGGIRIQVPDRIPKDTPVQLLFRLPEQRKPIVVGARVIYHRWLKESEDYLEAGLKFVELPIAEAVRITAFCNNI
jgi:hypothetical protein